MILIAGVVLAVLFVALAVLVNAAIYTDNVATRGSDSAGEVLAYQAGVTDSVGGLVDAENAVGGDVDSIRQNVSNGTRRIDESHRQFYLRRGAWTNATINTTDLETGLLIRETNATGFTNWTTNASAARGFVVDLDTANMTVDAAFRLDLDGTELEVNLNGTDQVVVTDGTGSVECAADADGTVRFDVTGERLGGQPCRFGWPALDDNSRIAIENADNGAGSIELTVDSNDSPANVSESITTAALYSVGLDLRVDTPRVSYETTVRVAPGEPDA
jgi:hypothetical protein